MTISKTNESDVVIHFSDPEEREKYFGKLLAWQELDEKGFKLRCWTLPKDGPARTIIEANCVAGGADALDAVIGGDDGVE